MKRLALLALAPLCVGTALATVNVNTAQQSELQRTPGLDKHKAKAIIEWRARNGSIDSFEELEKILGPAVTEKVKPQVAFAGDPYVPPPRPTRKKK